MIKYTLLIITSCLLAVTANGQVKSSNSKKITYCVGYFGNNIWYPGLKVGADYPLLQKIVRKRNDKKITKQFHLNGELGFYWHPKKHIATFTSFGIQKTRINQKGGRITYAFHPVGIYRSFLPETYEVSSTGHVEKIVLPGNFYYAPTFNAGIGKNSKNKFFKNSYLKANLSMLVKYNSSVLPLLSFEYGYRLTRKNNRNEIR